MPDNVSTPTLSPTGSQTGQPQSNPTAGQPREIPIHERPLTEVLPINFLRKNPSLQNFKNVGDLAISYVETKSALGKRLDGMVKIPNENSTPEEHQAYRAVMGIPEEASKYELPKLNTNVQVTAEEEAWYRQEALENGLSQKQFSRIFTNYIGLRENFLKQYNEQNLQSFQKEFPGEKYQEQVYLYRIAMQHLPPELAKEIENRPIFDISLTKVLCELGRLYKPAGSPSHPGMTSTFSQSRIDEIDSRLNDSNTSPSQRDDLLKEKRELIKLLFKA